MPKFKYGDIVWASGHKAKIISAWKDIYKGFMYRVEFENKFLIPREMEFEEEELTMSKVNISDEYNCPLCGKRWTITKFNMQVWKDCKRCNKKAEDILNMGNETDEELSKKFRDKFFTDLNDDFGTADLELE